MGLHDSRCASCAGSRVDERDTGDASALPFLLGRSARRSGALLLQAVKKAKARSAADGGMPVGPHFRTLQT